MSNESILIDHMNLRTHNNTKICARNFIETLTTENQFHVNLNEGCEVI
jgi:hypothetical protein